MTTFEITIIAMLAIIMLFIIIFVKTAIGGFHDVSQQLNANWEQLRKIETHTNFLADISRQLDNIEDVILDDLRDMNSQSICWSELTDDQKSEILYRLTHPVVECPFQPPFNPTCETTNKEE